MPRNLLTQIDEILAKFRADVEDKLEDWLAARAPVAFREMEEAAHADARRLADAVVEGVLRATLRDPVFQGMTSLAARGSTGRRAEKREVTVRLLGGGRVRVRAEYLRPGRQGRARVRKGGYPALDALGIGFGVTPALGAEICKQVTESESVRVGRAALARRGIDPGHKQTLRILKGFGDRAVAQRNQWLERARSEAATAGGALAGRRVVVAADGGRLRQRCPKRHGRPRKNGHRAYDAPWREPKLLTIYVIDATGKLEHTFAPVIDGTLDDADACFAMIVAYLRALGAHEASELIVVGDGAAWIWNRVPALTEALGIDPTRVREVIDFCHAVGALHEAAAAAVGWSSSDRRDWVARAVRHLRRGDVPSVLLMFDALGTSPDTEETRKHRAYFADNINRMHYRAFQVANVPIGSGAIESAIRRVVNLRMKGNGAFWLESSAQAMLLFRSYLKTGRFDNLFDWSISSAVPWWQPDGPPDLLKNPRIYA
ncbi:MAG: hypothetical protein KF729_12690 [Sandaracinaceae bacterium]|nr:hypothetical protein [Sandaracinaceae bacterium]